jgi:hypothetical protein
MDGLWREWAQEVEFNLTKWDNSRANIVDNRVIYKLYSMANESCIYAYEKSDSDMDLVPERPAMGSNLGPFSIVASWLLRTESLSLALIVGLFGFGLLGAACSTFVREHAQRQSGDPLVADLPSVLIRGLSAAIVVFLAVEGGLAVFSTGQSEPNPYVLLLTCLIAAVFSETVWKWARLKLQDSFPDRSQRVTDSTATPPTETPPSGT